MEVRGCPAEIKWWSCHSSSHDPIMQNLIGLSELYKKITLCTALMNGYIDHQDQNHCSDEAVNMFISAFRYKALFLLSSFLRSFEDQHFFFGPIRRWLHFSSSEYWHSLTPFSVSYRYTWYLLKSLWETSGFPLQCKSPCGSFSFSERAELKRGWGGRMDKRWDFTQPVVRVNTF